MQCIFYYVVFLCTYVQLPDINVASKRYNPVLASGISARGSDLFTDEPVSYCGAVGFVWHPIVVGSNADQIKIRLDSIYMINHIDLLLYDLDQRHYSYRIDVSQDDISWTTVVDRSNQRSMQSLDFNPTPAKFIRIVGT